MVDSRETSNMYQNLNIPLNDQQLCVWRYYKQETVWKTTYLGFLITAKRGLTL